MTLSSYEKLAKLAQQLVDTDSLGEIDHLSAAPLRKLLQKNNRR
jgi:hypothetical protein